MARDSNVHVQVAFDRCVLGYVLEELKKSPSVEEGGKYVGHLLHAGDRQLQEFDLDIQRPAIIITDFLPSGPKATRTAVELQPDGEYQEALFRRLEGIDPTVEHLGTWHSHHCNGLQQLSGGDVAGYFRTVNRSEYRPEYFLASLVKRIPDDVADRGWIDHFLFVKGADEYYLIANGVTYVEHRTTFGAMTGHVVSHVPADRRNARADTPERNLQRPEAWYETDEGRAALADDKRYLTGRFGKDLATTRRGQTITMSGREGHVTVSATYPSCAGDSDVSIVVRNGEGLVLQITTTIQWRRVAIAAALTAAASV